MKKSNQITVKEVLIRTLRIDDEDYICITDIAKQKNPIEPKDVVKNWMRLKNTLEYLGLWEQLNNPGFKGVEFDPLLQEAGSNSFTMSPTRWIDITHAKGIISKTGAGGGTYAQRDIAFKFASWVSVEFELYLIKEFQRLKPLRLRSCNFATCSKDTAIRDINSLIDMGILQKQSAGGVSTNNTLMV